MGRGQLLGAFPHRRGQQQLAAGRRPQAAVRLSQAALVGHLEVADLLDGVAPELDPHRMLLSGREDIEDAAPDSQLAAMFHGLGPRVADLDQPGDHVVEVSGVTGPEPDRLQLAQAADDRLEQAADRGGDHGERAGPGVGRVRVGEPAQHRQPLPGYVWLRRQPLVRQRLPGREAGRSALGQQRAERGGQVLCLPDGGRHGQHEPAGELASQGCGQQRAQGRRPAEIAAARRGLASLIQRMPQLRVISDYLQKAGEAHRFLGPVTG